MLPDILDHFPLEIQTEGKSYSAANTHEGFYPDKNKHFSMFFAEGKQLIHTQMEFDSKEDMIGFSCTCLLGNQRYCKHLVTVVLRTQTYLEELEVERAARKKRSKTSKKPSFAKLVKEMADDLSKEELLDFVLVNAKGNVPFQNKFLGHFMEKRAGKQSYLDLVQEWIDSALGRSKTLTDRSGDKLIGPLKELQKKAGKELKGGHWAEALRISMAILVKVAPVLEVSHANVGKKLFNLCNKVLQTFDAAVPAIQTPMQKEEWFETIMEDAASIGSFPSLKAHFLMACFSLALDDPMWARIEQALDAEIKPQEPYGTYSGFVLLKKELLEQRNRQREIPALLVPFKYDQNIAFHLAIAYSNAEEWQAAAEMAMEKLDLAARRQGHIDDPEAWAKVLVSCGQELEDRDMELKGMLEWKIANGDIWDVMEFQQFKAVVGAEKWPRYRKSILQLPRTRSVPADFYYVIAEIYLETNDFNRLTRHLKIYGNDFAFLSQMVPRMLPSGRVSVFRVLLTQIPHSIRNRSFDPELYFGLMLPLLKQQQGYVPFAKKLLVQLQGDWVLKNDPVLQRFVAEGPDSDSSPAPSLF